MFSPGERVGVAVSGGADSVALLHCLRELSPELGTELAVVHLNHQLRGPESDADEQFVVELARRLDLRCFTRRIDVAAEARAAGENIEQSARRFRYQWFTELIAQGHSERIATGHTQSDQAETVLFRLLRGTGSAGLAGIRPAVAPGVVRPLLEVSRKDVLAYLRRHGWSWREDSSNQQTEFSRNRIRHELLPQLAREWNPRLPEALSQLAQWAQAEEDYWTAALVELAERHIRADGPAIELNADALAALPEAVQRRLLRVAIERARGTLAGIDFDHVEGLRRLAAAGRGGGQIHLPGLHVQRSFERLRLSRPSKALESEQSVEPVSLDPPGTFQIPGGEHLVRLDLHERDQTISGWADNKGGYNNGRQQGLDWGKLPKPLMLRRWRPGDRYQPWGSKGPKKLKSLFQECKIAAWDRMSWPVITASVPGSHRANCSRAN